jgi:hypothetical protein
MLRDFPAAKQKRPIGRTRLSVDLTKEQFKQMSIIKADEGLSWSEFFVKMFDEFMENR